MNSSKVQTIINQIILENRTRIGAKAVRKQYAVAKWQIAKLTELGIIDFMPTGFGHSDAKAVINEAVQSRTAVFNRYGEGEEVLASALHTAIKSQPANTPSPIVAFLRSMTWR